MYLDLVVCVCSSGIECLPFVWYIPTWTRKDGNRCYSKNTGLISVRACVSESVRVCVRVCVCRTCAACKYNELRRVGCSERSWPFNHMGLFIDLSLWFVYVYLSLSLWVTFCSVSLADSSAYPIKASPSCHMSNNCKNQPFYNLHLSVFT